MGNEHGFKVLVDPRTMELYQLINLSGTLSKLHHELIQPEEGFLESLVELADVEMPDNIKGIPCMEYCEDGEGRKCPHCGEVYDVDTTAKNYTPETPCPVDALGAEDCLNCEHLGPGQTCKDVTCSQVWTHTCGGKVFMNDS